MKAIKIGLTLFAMLVMVTFSSAQTEKEAHMEKTEKLITYLELSEKQAVQARELNSKYFDLFAKADSPEEKKRLNDESQAEARKILTEEQYKKYQDYVTKENNPTSVPLNQNVRPVKKASAGK